MVRNSAMCCVPNCGKTRSDNVILHKFPSPVNEPDRFRTWIYSVGGDVLSLDNQFILDYRKVCHVHFEDKYITRSGRLSNIAVPTHCLKGITMQSAPLQIASNIQQTLQDVPPAPRVENINLYNVAPDNTSQSTTSSSSSACCSPLLDIGLSQDLLKQRQNKCSQTSTKGGQRQQTVLNDTLPPYTPRFSSEASNLAKHLKKLTETKDKYAVRLQKALSLSTNTIFQKAISNFTTMALLFVMMQFREINKKKTGRTFRKQEKIMALSLFKQGPKVYRWLRHIFVLPSPLTLSRMISTAALKTGINEKIFENLKKTARKMSQCDKLCILLFDEIAIKPHFEYDSKKDMIVGFVDNGKKRIKKIADHALVFMMKGVTKTYKQPISYTFCSGSTGKDELAQAIKDHIRKLKSSGFRVIATVCDQGASNMSAINSLIAETRRSYLNRNEDFTRKVFEIDGEEVIPLYDPPHLIKNIRNNLITKNLICEIDNEKKTAKWEHIVNLYKENPAYKGISLIPKVTEQHINPNKMPEMKVKFATQVLSKSVAINMGYLAEKGILDPSSQETADVILFFDELFDSVNGGFMNERKMPGKDLLGPLTPTSSHRDVWTKSKSVLSTMKFLTPEGKKSHVLSVPNWLRTLENLEYLASVVFQKYGIKSIWLRHFNLDPLENFFGCIRSHGARNNNPTCAQFEVAFAALLINNLNSLHSPGYNCEKDRGRGFKSLSKIFFEKPSFYRAPQHTTNYINIHISDHVFVGINNKKDNVKILAQIEYVTGYVLRKTKLIFKDCKSCKDCLYDCERSNQYIKVKENNKGKSFMSYPALSLVKCFSYIQDVVTNVLKTDCETVNIKNNLKDVLEIVTDFNFIKCVDHKNALTDQIIDLSCRFFLHHWCKINYSKERDRTDPEDEMSRNYYLKRRKRYLFG